MNDFVISETRSTRRQDHPECGKMQAVDSRMIAGSNAVSATVPSTREKCRPRGAPARRGWRSVSPCGRNMEYGPCSNMPCGHQYESHLSVFAKWQKTFSAALIMFGQ